MSEENVKRKFGFINRVDDVNWPPLSFTKVDVSYVSPSSIRSEVGEVEDIPDDTAYIVASRHTLAFRIRPLQGHVEGKILKKLCVSEEDVTRIFGFIN